MDTFNWKEKIQSFDERRAIIIPGDTQQTILFCIYQFLQIGKQAIRDHGVFSVALSGGQTPLAMFKELSNPSYWNALDWSKVICFWSDERNVPSNHSESNYFNAMEAGLEKLPLLPQNIFRIPTGGHIEELVQTYERLIREKVPSLQFDLIMLGMGDDGHTASLFPKTHGLHAKDRLIIANYVPQKDSWRISMTYECIHMAKNICIYVMGSKKAEMVAQVLLGSYDPDNLPVQRIGIPSHQALWILDDAAASIYAKKHSKDSY